jgi:hypothetical protein
MKSEYQIGLQIWKTYPNMNDRNFEINEESVENSAYLM